MEKSSFTPFRIDLKLPFRTDFFPSLTKKKKKAKKKEILLPYWYPHPPSYLALRNPQLNQLDTDLRANDRVPCYVNYNEI